MQIIWVARLPRLIVDSKVGHEDTGGRARYAFHGCARALETFVRDLEQVPLLRVHVRGLHVVDSEKVVVKLANILVDEIASGDIGATAAVAALGMVEPLNVVSFEWNCSLG